MEEMIDREYCPSGCNCEVDELQSENKRMKERIKNAEACLDDMTAQHHIDIVKVIIVTILVIAVSVFAGFMLGRSRPPTIKTILMEDKADREYIERYHRAGEQGYDYVLHKEYKMDAEFVIGGGVMEAAPK